MRCPIRLRHPITLFSGGKQAPTLVKYRSMVPANIKEQFHDWPAQVLAQGVHIRSKVIVLDPFDAKPDDPITQSRFQGVQQERR
jgi:hypothetical protein